MGNEMARMLWAQCWQVTLLIFCVALLSRWLGQNRPHLTHALWVVVLVKALTPPVWSSPSGLFSWLQAPKTSGEIRETIPPEEPPPAPAILPPQVPDVVAEYSVEAADAWTPIVPNEETRDLSSLIAEDVVAAETPVDAKVPSPAIAPPAASELPTSGGLWSRLILAVWITGALGTLLLALLRWLVCWREIRRAVIVHDSLAQALFETLRVRLRVRRKVKLIISQSRIGPAVIGFFRPTVLIPARVMAGKSAADLEPIFAHELIHIRRGDLLVGWLQMLAESVWWFHPLVHFAGRWLKQDAERCCDEEVIGELGLKPARYARVLLDVLELKHILKPVPVLPGVKPVEITSKRLERIMLLGQGCRKRTPWWCWVITLLAALITLPGAAFVAEAKDKSKPKKLEDTQMPDSSLAKTRNYNVGDVLQKIQAEFGIGEDAAREVLASRLKLEVDSIWHREQLLSSPGQLGTPSLRIKGHKLTVHHTPLVQKKIAEELERLREHGFQQIVIEVRIINARRELLEQSVKDWELLPAEIPAGDLPERASASVADRDFAANAGNGVQMLVEKSAPMKMALLHDPQVKALIEACQSDARSNLMFCPKVTVFNGQSATIQDSTQRPFVVNISGEGKPEIRVVTEGTSVKVRPVLEDKHIRLESELTLSDIRGVEVIDLPGEEESLKVQVPEVATTRINTTVKVPDGGSVLLGGIKRLREARNAAGTPILNKVPYVSRLFKNSDTGHENSDEQLFVLLRVIHLKDAPSAQAGNQQTQVRPQRSGRLHYGIGVNSEAGLAGQIILNESNVEPITIDPPTDEEVLKALETKAKEVPALLDAARKNVRIHKEMVSQSKSPPRDYPLVGPAELHLARFKCTVSFDEIQKSEWPVPFAHSGHLTQVAYIDKSRLVRVKQISPEPSKAESVVESRLLDRLRNHRQIRDDQGNSLSVVDVQDKKLIKPTLQYLSQGNDSITVQAASATLEFDVEKQLVTLHLVKGYIDSADDRRIWFEKESRPISLPQSLDAAAKELPKDQVSPSAAYLTDDVQYFPTERESAPLKAAPKSWPELIRQRARSKVLNAQESHGEDLSQKVSLAFKKTPLDEAMKDLAKKAGINIVVDNAGLAEEGITSEHPITLEVENVKVSTALKVILEPLSLCYELQDEVLKITSKTRLEIASLITATYPVADLIIPIPQRATLDLRDKEGSEKQTIAKEWNKPAPAIPEPRIYRHPKVAGSDDLIQLIQSTIDPNSWSEKGGSGSIRFFETTLSLVIRQTPKVHEELHDLLKQLRRLQDVQVSFMVQTVDIRHLDAKWLSKLKEDDAVPLTPAETVKIKEHFEKDAVRRWQAPKITLFNGQSVNVVLPDHQSKTGFGVDLSPVIAADRRSIRLGMIINSHADKDQQSSKQLSLKAGESLLVDVAKASRNGTSDGPKVMMLTPTMVVQEEEEELLGTEQK